MCRRYTTSEWVEKAQLKHGSKFRYTKVNLDSRIDGKVIITCEEHGNFLQEPASHLRGDGCPWCAGVGKHTTKSFIKKAKNIHGGLYSYARTKYTKASEQVIVTCREHGDFYPTAAMHLSGTGCPRCANKRRGTRGARQTTDDWIVKATLKWGDLYDYSKVIYLGCHEDIDIICKEHGEFQSTPSKHLAKQGCPICDLSKTKAYSFSAVQWIENYAFSHRLKNVQHALKGGEYNVPGKCRMFVDGFHARSNTIFEFHGSCWHGDPKVFKPLDRPHPHRRNVTATQLYMETKAKEKLILDYGYNLVVIWESDYLQGLSYSYKL